MFILLLAFYGAIFLFCGESEIRLAEDEGAVLENSAAHELNAYYVDFL
ncbi:hypothetical protein GWO43_25040 [candidate division KSB1 bacterium]|nr:hypothetical protein [candidate division KSB1 bacterium]NIS27194.1 hypothetical protein [candidate division KSB1 bacterium]NIT74079.1 hypothetical protein [candidate division KSB1 bacterium]NIU27928.1 hypothetical protein [candidate division KSB1 bacterium]NIU89749.1 hypothetical protein [candidate division KSB1 bacterium]